MAARNAQRYPYRTASAFTPRIKESWCGGCGLLIAASPSTRVLAIMERLHECPVYFRYHEAAGPRIIKRSSPKQ
ncbi:MAG: hypothetical protein DMG65_05600 [Candidatus Angelobacter sp. Gp1-AA117]|nr:MAG: hypothetical protein DMG65_05600 [Candidatus Angelobacter sp. Gp1-AA117]